MADLNVALAEGRAAIEELIASAERCAPSWTNPRAPGKWSPSQNVEHVARSLDESAKSVRGERSAFPTFPFFVRPLIRMVFFNRVMKSNQMSKAKTGPAFNPAQGPASPADSRARLLRAVEAFDRACREASPRFTHGIFGEIATADYAHFMTLHTRHHIKQMPN